MQDWLQVVTQKSLPWFLFLRGEGKKEKAFLWLGKIRFREQSGGHEIQNVARELLDKFQRFFLSPCGNSQCQLRPVDQLSISTVLVTRIFDNLLQRQAALCIERIQLLLSKKVISEPSDLQADGCFCPTKQAAVQEKLFLQSISRHGPAITC